MTEILKKSLERVDDQHFDFQVLYQSEKGQGIPSGWLVEKVRAFHRHSSPSTTPPPEEQEKTHPHQKQG